MRVYDDTYAHLNSVGARVRQHVLLSEEFIFEMRRELRVESRHSEHHCCRVCALISSGRKRRAKIISITLITAEEMCCSDSIELNEDSEPVKHQNHQQRYSALMLSFPWRDSC
jgi:predicted sulfurtransferase